MGGACTWQKNPQPRKEGEKEYNFHWIHTGDIWCADGMFGQTCATVPEQNMVIAITTADSNYLETELIQKEILDPMKEERNLSEKMWNVLKIKGSECLWKTKTDLSLTD